MADFSVPSHQIHASVGDTQSIEMPLNLLEDESDSKSQIAIKINKIEHYIAKAESRLRHHDQKMTDFRQTIIGNRSEIEAGLAVNHLDPNIGVEA